LVLIIEISGNLFLSIKFMMVEMINYKKVKGIDLEKDSRS